MSTPEGQTIFADNCAACHGEIGQGNSDMGAPIPDRSRSGSMAGSVAEIDAQVVRPRHGVMPAWAGRLADTTIKELAVYVHSLGGGL